MLSIIGSMDPGQSSGYGFSTQAGIYHAIVRMTNSYLRNKLPAKQERRIVSSAPWPRWHILNLVKIHYARLLQRSMLT